MKLRNFAFIICCSFFLTSIGAELISLTVGAGAMGALGFFFGDIGGIYTYTKCKFYECCGETWIDTNIATSEIKQTLTGGILINNLELEDDVDKRLYGQHIARNTVINALRAHMSKKNPSKALVMSFHGWTGSGKNYLAKMIAKAIFKKEMRSQFVHLYVATHHFPHAEQTEKYKDQLRTWIHGNLTKCERSLFVFDEMDKLPIQLLDAIIPFIDFYDQLNGVDARKSIFLFLSNGGANSIAQRALEYYNQGRPREDISFQEMEEIMQISAYNEGEGGLKSSRLINKHLIDYFIPFLPLERKHVVMCFKDYLKSRNVEYTAEQLERLTNSIPFFPKDTPIFALSGCKQVVQKADFMLNDLIREAHHQFGHQHSIDEI